MQRPDEPKPVKGGRDRRDMCTPPISSFTLTLLQKKYRDTTTCFVGHRSISNFNTPSETATVRLHVGYTVALSESWSRCSHADDAKEASPTN